MPKQTMLSYSLRPLTTFVFPLLRLLPIQYAAAAAVAAAYFPFDLCRARESERSLEMLLPCSSNELMTMTDFRVKRSG